MVIYTNTEKLRAYRKLIVELLLASHDRECTTCEKSGQCPLQNIALRLGVNDIRFANYKERQPLDESSVAIIRDPNKCILCGNCVRECNEVQTVGALDFAFRGSEATVTPAFNRPLAQTQCVSCGQCRVVCDTGALSIRSHTDQVWAALNDPKVRVVAQIAPAVRVAIGEAFGLPSGQNALYKLVSALHLLGFNRVFDTTYAADLTVMEESAEFLTRLGRDHNIPLLTSCCPGWVKFVENEYPEFKRNLSTCRSPQAMFSAVLKEYYAAPEHNVSKKDTFVVSIMPCTAKKAEAERPGSYTYGRKDTDAVITTTELVQMIRQFGLDFANLPEEACDMPFGMASGGGVIFGVTGGVTEAVLRRLLKDNSPKSLDAVAQSGVRGNEGIKELTIPYNGTEVKICVVSGLGNARKVMDAVRTGEKHFDMIEVMACPGGCVMGGGQPTRLDHKAVVDERDDGIYRTDRRMVLKKANENPLMDVFYQNEIFKHKFHDLLHVAHD